MIPVVQRATCSTARPKNILKTAEAEYLTDEAPKLEILDNYAAKK